MSLSGNLGFVPLDELLRLLTRSNQQGSVDVRGQQIHGRIFINKGQIELATTTDDAGLRRHLVKAGIVDQTAAPGIDSGQQSLAEAAANHSDHLVELLREMTVESLYQMDLRGDAFEVNRGVSTPYASPRPFDLEGLLEDSKKRGNDWAEVCALIPDVNSPMSLVRGLGERDDIIIDKQAWRVISEMRSGSSVADIADRLGTTEFWTAKVTSRLVDQDLAWVLIPETGDEESAETVSEVEDTEEKATEEFSQVPTLQTTADSTEVEEVEEDTETFLEKVFAELDAPDEPEEQQSQEQSYGLLGRRRLGSMRDGPSDSLRTDEPSSD